ncbi:MAG: hypothetical protein LAO30_19500 [Acidobacteriia bacterium]|nr:hypothetical protein [Terriglobia bacterium]
MEDRDDWIRELERRQDNIDPIRRIPNGALFQGALINGNLHLNRVQRAGAVFLGLCGLAEACYIGASAFAELRAGRLPDFGFLIFFPFTLWIGWKITKNALINDPAKARRRKTQAPN